MVSRLCEQLSDGDGRRARIGESVFVCACAAKRAVSP